LEGTVFVCVDNLWSAEWKSFGNGLVEVFVGVVGEATTAFMGGKMSRGET